MSLQAQIDEWAINLLPRIKKLIRKAERFEANQMYCYALRKCANNNKALEEMNKKEIIIFQKSLVKAFKFNEWIK